MIHPVAFAFEIAPLNPISQKIRSSHEQLDISMTFHVLYPVTKKPPLLR
jgi:hypothetical protein